MSNWQLDKLKSGIKYGNEVILNFSSILMMKLIFNINYYYLKHKLQDFANGSADNIKFSKPK